MLRAPQTTFARLALAMAGALAAVLVITILGLRAMAEQNIAAYADLVAGNVEAARAGSPTRSAWPLESVDVGELTPVTGVLPRRLAERIADALGPGTEVWWASERANELRVRLAGDVAWIAVRVPALLRDTLWASIVSILVGAGVVIAVAAWFAHGITRPLDRLAATAPQLALTRIDPDVRLVPATSPREVLVLEAALRRAAEDVQATARDREQLLTGVSHDLRTPLSRLRMAIEIQQGIPAEDRAGLIDDLDEMNAIIGQFLDFVRDGRDEPRERVDVAKLLRGLVAEAARAGVSWTLRTPDELLSDLKPLAIRRAVRNLTGNAEHHGAPPYLITLELVDGYCRLSVIDHGPGVPAEQLTKLGRPFYRGGSSRGGSTGSGLGLSLARRVALIHGGSLEISSKSGEGFEATFSWPQHGLGPTRNLPPG